MPRKSCVHFLVVEQFVSGNAHHFHADAEDASVSDIGR